MLLADVVNKEQVNLKDILSDISQQERGVLRFGASNLRLNMCLPAILPQFSARYPNVDIRITDFCFALYYYGGTGNTRAFSQEKHNLRRTSKCLWERESI